jgi:hypothetical protein
LEAPLYLEKGDNRMGYMKKQLKKEGFCDSETWALYACVAEFILPRLQRFKEVTIAYPMGLTPEKWEAMIDEMIFAFDWTLNEEELHGKYSNLTKEEKDANWKRYENGMRLFGEWFRALWW